MDADKRLERVEKALERIERCLIGDSELGNPGIVKRVGKLEGQMKFITKRMTFVGGGVAVVVWLITHFGNKL